MLESVQSGGMDWAAWIRLASIPLVGALIGYVTNWLAVKMIFRPRRPIRLLGISWQGLVPRRQPELAASIGHTVQRHLISHDDLRRILEKPSVQQTIEKALHEKIASFLDLRVGQIHPMLGTFLRGSLRDKLEGMVIDELRRSLVEFSGQLLDRLEDEIDFQRIVEEKVRAFDLDRLESIIQGIAHRELKSIEWAGALLGGLIGLAQLAILLV